MLKIRVVAALFGSAILTLAAPVRIVLVGDSTVNDEGGWAPGFTASFSGAPAEVINLARNGRSSKSFRDEGHWAKVLEGPKPDYVLIQFGHNDCPGKGPDRETDPQTTYRANLTRYIRDVQGLGGKPVLVTSIVRRNFDDNGKLKQDCLIPFVDEARRLGSELGVPVMDLFRLTWAQTEALGKGRADALGAVLPDGKPDRTHLGARGQLEIGAMAAREFARVVPAMSAHVHSPIPWSRAISQAADWYGSAEAIRIADSLLLHQQENGGWLKNTEMSLPPMPAKKESKAETTIDNGATWTQMQYLARVYTATQEQRFAAAFRRGFRFLLAAQYPSGGWPQFYPLREGYYTHITHNDNAMSGVMTVLQSVAEARPEYQFMTSDEQRQAREAAARGTEVILRSQIVVEGKRTVWCAQHDETTFEPAKARSYELPSYSGMESVALVRLLMGIEKPSREVIEAVEGAVSWFRAHEIRGIRLLRKPDPATPKGYDTLVVQDPKAPPLWARFYDLKDAEPMFCGRDGVPKKSLVEIEYERRNGYSWYTDAPSELLEQDYPRWKATIRR